MFLSRNFFCLPFVRTCSISQPTRRVGWLMEQVRTNGKQKKLRDKNIDLGTRYGIVTPYTSYLALEDGAVSQNNYVGGQPVNRREYRGSVFGNALSPRPASEPKVDAQTGADAVQLSKMQREQQDVMRVDEAPPS